MPANQTTARDEILGRLKAVTDAGISGLTTIYDDASLPIPTDGDPVPTWCRAVVKHTTGGQASLSGALGTQRYERTGLIIVQLFTPGAGGQVLADSYGGIIRGAFEAHTTPGGVWFKNARANEVGQDGPWFQTNIFVEFSYDEIK